MSNAHRLEISSLAYGGDGIGRIDGQVCFVPFASPGDVLDVEIVRTAKRALWGRIIQIHERSQDRLAPTCAGTRGHCAACTWSHFRYPAQAVWKQRLVAESLRRIGGVEVPVAWREMPALRHGYRTRAIFHGDGERFGFYIKGTREIDDLECCSLCHERLNRQLPALHAGGAHGTVTVTVNPEGDEVLVWSDAAQPALAAAFPLANCVIDGPNRAYFLFDGVPIVNGGFSQASLLLNRLLRSELRRLAGIPSRLLDLYCGNGNLSLTLPVDTAVQGIDRDPATVAAANAVRSGSYVVGDERAMSQAIQQGAWEVILLDPPRTGASAVVPALAESAASRLIYVSCDAPTLGRDLKRLLAAGWRIDETVALDLFPHTPHVEVVCALSR